MMIKLKIIVKLIIIFHSFYSLLFGSDKIKNVTLIGGTGAMGAFFVNQCLLNQDIKTVVVGQSGSMHLEAIQKEGLTIHFATEQKTIRCHATDSYNTIEPHTQELILVTLKQPLLTDLIAKNINYIATKEAIVGFICNGIPFYYSNCYSFDSKLSEAFSTLKLFHINPLVAAEIISHGHIRINNDMNDSFIEFARVQNCTIRDSMRLSQFFSSIKIRYVDHGDEYKNIILEKMKYSLSISTICALKNTHLDDVFYDPKYQYFIQYCINIINTIAYEFDIKNMKNYEDFKKHPPMNKHFPSLYVDIKNKKPNEIEFIVGRTIQLAQIINDKNKCQKMDIILLQEIYNQLCYKASIQSKL